MARTRTTKLIPFQFDDANIFCDNMEEIKTSYPQTEIHSKWNPLGRDASRYPNKISATLWSAIRIHEGYGDRRYFSGKDADANIYVELGDTAKADDPQTTVVIAKHAAIGINIVAGTVTGSAEKPVLKGDYKIRTRTSAGRSGTAIVLAMMPAILADDEAKECYDRLSVYAGYDADSAFWTKGENLATFSKELCLFTDNVYRRCKGDADAGSSLEIPYINRPHTDDLNVEITHVYNGDAKFFRKVSIETKLAALELAMDGDYTAEEKAMIPELTDDIIIPKLAVDVATSIKLSSKFSLEPFRVCGFFGPAGCGKTMLRRICGNLLQLPTVSMTMNEDTDKFDLIGTLLPACATREGKAKSVSFDDVRRELGLPTTEDAQYNTESAYITLFKRPMPEGTESSDVIAEIENRVGKEIKTRLERGDYTFVKSPLVQAIENGYLCEIQEIGAVRKQSVVMALNAWLETGENAFATLTTGQTIKKHPNCVIMFTSNDGYEGTRKVQLSVFDRYAEVYWLNGALPEVMAQRAYNVNKGLFTDMDQLIKMAKVMQEITLFSDDRMIKDGIAGQRSLNNWVTKCLIIAEITGREIDDELIREAMQTTVVSKISQNVEDIEDVVAGVVDKYFPSYVGRGVRRNME